MSRMYAMRGANGDWFALDDHGHLRVPVFCSSRVAMQARACNSQMLPFTPVALDDHSLMNMVSTEGECLISFWLVWKSSSTSVNCVYPLEYAQIAILVSDPRTGQAVKRCSH